MADCRGFLGIEGLDQVRILNRYDAENIDPALFDYAKTTVFSEPQLDTVSETAELSDADAVFAVEPLPGQFDQRADSAAQCIQLLSQGERPTVRTAKVYGLYGALTATEVQAVKRYVINPVESREASLDRPETLQMTAEQPDHVETVEGFTGMDEAELPALLERLGLAMDFADLKFLQAYFRDEERRDPSITEIRVVDTYWSDHCRHTTFSAHLDSIEINDEAVRAAYERYLALREEVYGAEKAAARPQTLMDVATLGAKVLKKRGKLPELDESEEINACSIHVPAVVDGETRDWLLISFAIAPILADEVLSPEFKEPGHPVYLFSAERQTEDQQPRGKRLGAYLRLCAVHHLHDPGRDDRRLLLPDLRRDPHEEAGP